MKKNITQEPENNEANALNETNAAQEVNQTPSTPPRNGSSSGGSSSTSSTPNGSGKKTKVLTPAEQKALSLFKAEQEHTAKKQLASEHQRVIKKILQDAIKNIETINTLYIRMGLIDNIINPNEFLVKHKGNASMRSSLLLASVRANYQNYTRAAKAETRNSAKAKAEEAANTTSELNIDDTIASFVDINLTEGETLSAD